MILNKPGYIFYSVYFSAYTLLGFAIIYDGLRKARGLFRTYLKFLFSGLIVAFTFGATFNLFYPAFGNYQYIWVGPLFILVYTAFTSYAIIKHKLFDIRAFVVRALAYTSTFAVMSLLFIVPSLLITNYFLETDLSSRALILLGAVMLLAALLFQTIKKYFNRLTGQLFYRDYYEPQAVLNEISNLLVGSVDLAEIRKKSSDSLQKSLRPSFVEYLLQSSSDTAEHRELLVELDRSHKDLVVFDDLDLHAYQALYEKMRASNVALAVKLKTRNEKLGYLLLGFKQSGGLYSEDDQRLLDILADQLAVGLQNALRFKEIQQFNVTLQEKIKAATAELTKINARLRELDKTKDEFIGMASHQLRTPLTAIKGYLSMVLEGDVGQVTKAEKEYIKKAFDSAQKMVYLIADMLNVSRLQTGKFVIENHPTKLDELVESEVNQLQAEAEQHKLKLVYHKPVNFPVLNLDENKIRQVVMNFIDNAIYYTPAGGSVTVDLKATDNEVILTVTDTGMGVPAQLQHRLFSKFYRADNARKVRPDGTGLGLFLTKKVITAQGGAIIFKSTEGKGSTFGFSFPLRAVVAGAK